MRGAGCGVQGAGCGLGVRGAGCGVQAADLGLGHRDREVGLERVERIRTQHAKLQPGEAQQLRRDLALELVRVRVRVGCGVWA